MAASGAAIVNDVGEEAPAPAPEEKYFSAQTWFHVHLDDAAKGGTRAQQIAKSKKIRVVGLALAFAAFIFTAVGAGSGATAYDTISNVHFAALRRTPTEFGNSAITNVYFGNYRMGVFNQGALGDLASPKQFSLKYDNCNQKFQDFNGTMQDIVPFPTKVCDDCKDAFDAIEATTIISIIIHVIGVPFHIMHMSESMNSDGMKYLIIVWYLIGFAVNLSSLIKFTEDCLDSIPDGPSYDLETGPSYGLLVTTLIIDVLVLPIVAMAETALKQTAVKDEKTGVITDVTYEKIPTMQSVPCTGLFWHNLCCAEKKIDAREGAASSEV